jgi:hypothetical protein
MRIPKLLQTLMEARRLFEGVGAGSPVGEEQAETDSLEDTGNGTDGDGVKWALLSENLGDDLRIVSFNMAGRCRWDDVRREQRKP